MSLFSVRRGSCVRWIDQTSNLDTRRSQKSLARSECTYNQIHQIIMDVLTVSASLLILHEVFLENYTIWILSKKKLVVFFSVLHIYFCFFMGFFRREDNGNFILHFSWNTSQNRKIGHFYISIWLRVTMNFKSSFIFERCQCVLYYQNESM